MYPRTGLDVMAKRKIPSWNLNPAVKHVVVSSVSRHKDILGPETL
jgi:hypothetical protein